MINDYWEPAELPWPLLRRLADLGLYSEDIEGYGCPGMSPLARGLVNMELHRGDGSLGTFLGVQSGLAMKSIALLGSEAQKERWLPAMARLDKIGAFALTEPAHGSDSVALETSARREDDGWVIDGAKRWIGNGSIADVVIVWARDVEDGQVKGFLVETTDPGYHAETINGKAATRAIWQAQISLDGARGEWLPGSHSFKDAGRVLVTTRATCAWGALGHAVAAYDAALTYSKQRVQFGKPLCSFQIVQDRLVKMLAEVTGMQLYCSVGIETGSSPREAATRSSPCLLAATRTGGTCLRRRGRGGGADGSRPRPPRDSRVPRCGGAASAGRDPPAPFATPTCRRPRCTVLSGFRFRGRCFVSSDLDHATMATT